MADPIAVYERLQKDPVIKATLLDGARTRGHGDMISPLWGNMDHHTGASGNSSPWSIANHPSLGLCSQFFLPRNGKLVICGYGIAWHGGSGSGYGIRDVNAQLTGMEMDNNGTEGWGSIQYWNGVRINAIIHLVAKTKKHGSLACNTIGHKEWAGAAQGKWDPGGMNMSKRRSDIAAVMAELGAPIPPRVIRNEIDHVRSFSPWLGAPTSGELPLRGSVSGKVRRYERGNIYWLAATNSTVPVPTAILDVYERFDFENGLLGVPLKYHALIPAKNADGNVIPDLFLGDVQGFKNGAIQRRYGHDGYALYGQIGERYAREQWHEGSLGFAISDEYEQDGIIRQDFEHGALLCDRNGTVKLDRGDYLYIPPGR
ncbi:endolysin [Gordonia phage Petra]|uniref:Lysin A n=2 Tax=root TaxID=1 RepID=A0A2U8UKC2_9CAUD|nr:N-acetylmuramoyl-L-alanine amidase [Gordonia westfalica]YP_010095416.1 endolysin [Gordonia phage Petra]AWN04135.1 lysin A [Gordonia phage Petra]SDU64482.1 N-acetylmuramoyl-L-alanine amidase [Gordonia westfalica]